MLKIVKAGQLRQPKVWLKRGSWSSLEAACLGAAYWINGLKRESLKKGCCH